MYQQFQRNVKQIAQFTTLGRATRLTESLQA